MFHDPRDMTVDREIFEKLKKIEERFHEVVKMYKELSDKYAAALGREAELRALLDAIERPKLGGK